MGAPFGPKYILSTYMDFEGMEPEPYIASPNTSIAHPQHHLENLKHRGLAFRGLIKRVHVCLGGMLNTRG